MSVCEKERDTKKEEIESHFTCWDSSSTRRRSPLSTCISSSPSPGKLNPNIQYLYSAIYLVLRFAFKSRDINLAVYKALMVGRISGRDMIPDIFLCNPNLLIYKIKIFRSSSTLPLRSGLFWIFFHRLD